MKTVLITGCSSGIGKETVLLFQENGWNVAATARDPDTIRELAAFKNVKCYRIDVMNMDTIAKCIRDVISDFGSIDVLVNNAGVYTTKPLESVSEDEAAEIIETNIAGTLRMIRAVLPFFRTQKHGTIINISSVAGRITFPYQTIYHGTKWAVEGISESLRYELKQFNIRVRVVEPGMVKTELYKSILGLTGNDFPEEYRKSFSNWHTFLTKNFSNGYHPRRDAQTIYKAATRSGVHFRYTTDITTRILLIMRSLLPFRVLTWMVGKSCGI
jgi:NADP-dependent 3-hydroxy acid dehydrogenase YdfG